MNRIKLYIIILLVALGIAGCGDARAEGQEQANTEREDSNLVPIASLSKLTINFATMNSLCLDGEYLYFVQAITDKQASNQQSYQIFRKDMLSDTEPEALLQDTVSDFPPVCLTVDKDANLYCFGLMETEQATGYYLGKWDQKGEQEFIKYIKQEEISMVECGQISKILLDEDKRIYLYNEYGFFCFFDADGNMLAKQSMEVSPTSKTGLVGAGGKKVYAYRQSEQSVCFYPVDREKGCIEEKNIQRVEFETGETSNVCDSQNGKIYLPTRKVLYEYNPDSGEKTAVVGLQEDWVSVSSERIKRISVLESGEMVMLLGDFFGNEWEQAVITWTDKAKLPESRKVVLGVVGQLQANGILAEEVSEFNRQSKDWKVELKNYSPDTSASNRFNTEELNLELIQGIGPDMFLLDNIMIASMNEKGILEDLTPYFEQSSVVRKEDLLESILSAGSVDGKLVGVMPYFNMLVLFAPSVLEQDGWTYEELLEYAENRQGENLHIDIQDPKGMLRFLFHSGMKEFADVESGKCRFDEDRFRNLLQRIKDFPYMREEYPSGMTLNDYWQRFQEGTDGICEYVLISTQNYLSLKKMNVGFAKWMGYPTADGHKCTLLNGERLGINSASSNKEGAWKFLEFLLSDTEQGADFNEYKGFPVKKDAFEAYIKNSYLTFSSVEEILLPTEEDFNLLREMAENAEYNSGIGIDPVRDIVMEECGAFFSGDKTADEAADIIQNRVQLYLDEMGTG